MYEVTVIKAKDCGACHQLDQNGTTKRVLDSITAQGHRTRIIDLPTRGSQHTGNTKWDRFINSNLRLWFPLFFVAKTSDIQAYNMSTISDDVMKTRVSVFNGSLDSSRGTFTNVMKYKYMNPEVIRQWIADFTTQIGSTPLPAGNRSAHPTGVPETVVISDNNSSSTLSCSSMKYKIKPRY